MLAAAALGVSPWGKTGTFPQALVGRIPGAERPPPGNLSRAFPSVDLKKDEKGDGTFLSMCTRLHDEGAYFDGVATLQMELFDRFKGSQIVLIVPEDPYKGESHSVARQYARLLSEWEAVTSNTVHLSYYVKEVGSDTPLPNVTGNENFVWIEMPTDATMSGLWNLMNSGAKSAMVMHDSLCFEPEGTGFQGGYPIGCPNLGDDMRGQYESGGLHNRLYFTPWGSQQSELYPDKTKNPSMFVDATRTWEGISVNDFVETVRDAIPEMAFTIIGGHFDEPTTLKFVHYELTDGDKLPLDQFHQMLNQHWFFASGVGSSYELSLSDAAMAGTVLIDVGQVAKAAVAGPETVRINSKKQIVPKVQEAVDSYADAKLAAKTRKWAQQFHSTKFVGLGLLCAITADQDESQRDEWTQSLFKPGPLIEPPKEVVKWYVEHTPGEKDSVGMLLNKELASCVGNASFDINASVQFEMTSDVNENGKILAIGTVMEDALRQGDMLLGAGSHYGCTLGNGISKDLLDATTIGAVRGQSSLNCTEQRAKMVGDPALLLPYLGCPRWSQLLELPQDEKTQVCLVPHKVERSLVEAKMTADSKGEGSAYLLLDSVDTSPYDFAFAMAKRCVLVVSSSLYGLVMADALQVPSLRWTQAGPVGDVKLQDYFSGIDYWNHTAENDEVQELSAIVNHTKGRQARIQYDAISAKATQWLELVRSSVMAELEKREADANETSSQEGNSTGTAETMDGMSAQQDGAVPAVAPAEADSQAPSLPGAADDLAPIDPSAPAAAIDPSAPAAPIDPSAPAAATTPVATPVGKAPAATAPAAKAPAAKAPAAAAKAPAAKAPAAKAPAVNSPTAAGKPPELAPAYTPVDTSAAGATPPAAAAGGRGRGAPAVRSTPAVAARGNAAKAGRGGRGAPASNLRRVADHSSTHKHQAGHKAKKSKHEKHEKPDR